MDNLTQPSKVVFVHGRPGPALRSALQASGYCLDGIFGHTTIWTPRRCSRLVVSGHDGQEHGANSLGKGRHGSRP
jgi:hypothetical protein